MNDDRIIKYENVRNENYQIINLHRNGTIEHLLIHEFETDYGSDYLVVGKSTASIPSIVKEGTGWSNIIDRVVSAYKDNLQVVLNSNETTYYNVANIPSFYFTKEGYDLITHKFLFTNNEIVRTVSVGRQQNNNKMFYTNEYKCLDNDVTDTFRRFEYLEKNYTIRTEEYSNLNLEILIKYARANFIHLRNVYLTSPYRNKENDNALLLGKDIDRNVIGDNILFHLIMLIDAINTYEKMLTKEQTSNKKK